MIGLPLILHFFDRGANPCSLVPPPAALAGVAHPEHGDEGTTAQILISVWIKAENGVKYFSLLKEVESIYKVYDEEGNNLVLSIF